MQKKNGFVEFHHFMKKERVNNSSKNFLNQWWPIGFCKWQTKKMWGNFYDKIETCWLSSFFLNLSTGEWEQNREREKTKNIFKSVVAYWVFVNGKQKKCEEISMTRSRHVNFLHYSSIYPQESENKTEKGKKPKAKIIATIAS